MNQKLSDTNILEIWELYKDGSNSVISIGKKFGVTRTTIKNAMKRNGYPVREPGFKLGNKRGGPNPTPCTDNLLWFKKHSYEKRCARIGREFTLTSDQFIKLVTSKCTYCGKCYTDETRNLRKLKVNMLTIDRIDNSKGYTPDNCTPACYRCNVMKMGLTATEFLDKIAAIYKHTNKQQETREEKDA